MPAEEPPAPPARRLTGLGHLVGALRNLGLLGRGASVDARFEQLPADDGQAIPVRVLGSGPPVVLVHGLGCSHRHWMPVARRLARCHRVHAWDARGHGACHPVRGRVTLARLAQDLGLLLDHFGLARAALVGHSMGALTVMQYLHTQGTERVAAVALVDQSPRVVTDDDWPLGLFGHCRAEQLEGLISAARHDLTGTVLRQVEQSAGARVARWLAAEAPLGRLLHRWLDSKDASHLLDLAESLALADFRHSLRRLDVPLQVVLGARSPHYAGLPLDDWYRSAVPHAEVIVYPRAGHSPHVSEPARFARELMRFLSDHA
jgi:pimeloyl-ACP methyl ester carboxylesterase